MVRPFRTLLPALLLTLAACATPREACEAEADAPYRAALREQARIAKDLARGFRYKTEFERVRRWALCRNPNGVPYHCWRRDTRPVTRKVAIDREALLRRQAVLNRQIPILRETAAREAAQCRALYPADTP